MNRDSHGWTALVETPDGSAFDSAYITEYGNEVTEDQPYVDPVIAMNIGALLVRANIGLTPEVQAILQLRVEGRISSRLAPALGRLLRQSFMIDPLQIDPHYDEAAYDPDNPGPVDLLIDTLERNLYSDDLQVMNADGVHLVFDPQSEAFVPFAEGGYHPEMHIELQELIEAHSLGDYMGLQSVLSRDQQGLPHVDAYLTNYPVGHMNAHQQFDQTATVLGLHYLDYVFLKNIGARYRP